MKRLTNILWILLGSLSVVVGIIGIFVPLLPTAPFLLFAAYCYARSSERFYNWLMNNRVFGSYIKNYREGRGILMRDKIVTLVVLWITISYTSFIAISVWWGKVGMLLFAIVTTIRVMRIKTYRPDSHEVPASDEINR